MKKISVIIPCYNAEKYIAQCLESVAKQSIGMEALEVILVNDASIDATPSHLMQFEARFPESVIVINLEQNLKQGGARNVGLSYASGEYVVFLDADDWIDKDFYNSLYQVAKEHDTDVVQYAITNCTFDENGAIAQTKVHRTSKGSGFYEITDDMQRKQFLNIGILNYGSQTKFYKNTFLHANHPAFMEGVAYEEPSFVYPLLYTVERVYIFEEPWYYCRIHRESTMQSYVRQRGKLYDHPKVQLRVLETMRAKSEIYTRFREEIDYYFLFTFYYETLYFAKHGNLYLGFDFFQIMQQMVRTLVPDWRENQYVQLEQNRDVYEVLETSEASFSGESFSVFLNDLFE